MRILEVFDWISRIIAIFGLWKIIVGVFNCLVICWMRLYYVYRLRHAREETRERIQRIADQVQSSSIGHPNSDGVASQTLYSDLERGSGIPSQDKDGLCVRFSAFFRNDFTLQRLEELERELVHWRLKEIMAARIPVGPRQNGGLPTADVSSLRGGGNNIQANATGQPAGFASHDLSGSNSTGTEAMGTGTGPGNLRQSVSQSVSQSELSGKLPQKHPWAKLEYRAHRSLHGIPANVLKSSNDSRLSGMTRLYSI